MSDSVAVVAALVAPPVPGIQAGPGDGCPATSLQCDDESQSEITSSVITSQEGYGRLWPLGAPQSWVFQSLNAVVLLPSLTGWSLDRVNSKIGSEPGLPGGAKSQNKARALAGWEAEPGWRAP